MEAKNLYLLDAYGLIYRAYYAFIRRPVFNRKGLNTSTIYGFMASLEEIIRKEKPSHLAVVFDPPGGSFRQEVYKEYKANREATPEDIRISIPYIKSLLKAMNISIMEVKGFEADDVVGTIAKKAEQKGYKVFMVTSDKDYGQLVSENIKIYKPKKGGNDIEILGPDEINAQYGIKNPVNVIDVLALWGDASDNVPGAPGIGEKGAKKLIAEYETVEKLIENSKYLTGKIKESVEQNIEKILLSKNLVSIRCDVPIEIDDQDILVKPYNEEELRQQLNELDFSTLASRLLGKTFVAEQAKAKPNAPVQGSLFDMPVDNPVVETTNENYQTIENITHEYHIADTDQKIFHLVEVLQQSKEYCFDTETTGLDVMNDEVIGISFSVKEHEAWYVPIEKAQTLEHFKCVLENKDILKIGHNIKFDMLMLARYNIQVQEPFFDTLIAHYLLKPEQNHKMDSLAKFYLNYKPVAIEELIGEKGKNQRNMKSVALETIAEYAAEDADITFQLKTKLEPELVKNNLLKLFQTIEMPLIPVLSEMEIAGVKIDSTALEIYAKELTEKIIGIENEIYKAAGINFNISSPKQLGDILFDRLKISDKAKKTKTHQYATNEETLLDLRENHPIIDKILDYRGLKKLLNTYVEALPQLVNTKTGKIHSSFNQSITATGRLSSTNPNLQNIPIRDEEGREIRKAFIPSTPEHLIVSADYSQIELRIMAHICEDPNMIEAFLKNEDIHASTAAKIYNIPVNEVTSDMRRKAKTANFGIIYGISSFGLSQRLKIPRAESKELIDNYFKVYPGVKEYMNRIITNARENGFVTTLYDRRRSLPDIRSANGIVRGNAERNAINTPVQGTAADIIKIAMVNISKKLKKEKLQSKMILQVHDELLFDVFKPELEKVKLLVKTEMEAAAKLKVPITVEAGAGMNWLEAH